MNDPVCDRCHRDDGTVELHDFCLICGPLPLGRTEKPECTISGCSKKAKTKSGGMCSMHIARVMRHGDPHFVKRGPRRADWAGDRISYRSLHMRIQNVRGKASQYQCAACESPAQEWAYDYTDPEPREVVVNGSKIPFSIDIYRYTPMCRRCHKRHDNAKRGIVFNPRDTPEARAQRSQQRRQERAAQLEEMRRLYVEEGLTVVQISALIGLDNSGVSRGLRSIGVQMRRTKIPSQRIPEIMERRRRGETLQSIADDFGVHNSHIWRIAAGQQRAECARLHLDEVRAGVDW